MILPQVIFEDKDLLVIDKPAGWIVNKSDTSRYVKTIQEWAEENIPQLKSELAKSDETSEFKSRGGIVHRLDKETSGILLIAKNEIAFENLQSQFKNRQVKKTYIVLVHGRVEPGEGEIDITMGRLPWNRTRFGVLPEGRNSHSKYITISNLKMPIIDKRKGEGDYEDMTLLEFYPTTGRTHQIRVHAKHIGYPVYADELYAGRKTAKRDRKLLDRQFLHASKIHFLHPTTGESLEFESKLPTELESLLKKAS